MKHFELKSWSYYDSKCKISFFILATFWILSCTNSSPKTLVGGQENAKTSAYFKAKRGDFVRQITKRGMIRPANKVELRASKKVKISKILVKNLQGVKKGDLLVEVDKTELLKKQTELNDKMKSLELEISTLQVKFGFQEKNLGRKKPLFEKGIIPKKEYDEVEKEYRVSENDLKAKKLDQEKAERERAELEEQLKVSNFYAPMDGTVSGLVSLERSPNPEVDEGQPVAVVSDPKSLALYVSVEETYLPNIRLGGAAKVQVESVPDVSFSGTIKSINPENSMGFQKIKLFEVVVLLKDAERLQDGFSGSALLFDESKPSTMTVPLGAIQYVDGKPHGKVASAEGGKAELRPLELGEKSDTEVEVLSGIGDNDFVVVEG